MKDKDRKFTYTLIGITAAAFAARLIFLIFFDNVFSHEAEAYSKINLVVPWLEAGKPYPDVNFGPLHTWLIYLLTLPFENHVLPVRLFSLVCGTAAIYVYGHLVALFFEERAALIAAAMLAVIPVHLRGSATSLAMAPYVLFIGCGLYFHFRYRLSRHSKFLWLVGSAAFLNLAGMLRFEAWLMLPLLCLFLVRKNFLHAVAFGAMNLAFPLLHMFMCYSQTGNPVSFAATSSASFLQYMPTMSLSYKLTGWFISFAQGLSIGIALLCAVGLIFAAMTARGFYFAALFVFNFAIFQYKTLTNTIDPSLIRYTAGMALLLMPFGAYLITGISDRLFSRRKRTAAIMVMTILIAAQALTFAVLQAKEQALPKDVVQTVEFIRDNAGPDDVIMADSRFHPYFMIESRLAGSQFVSLEFTPDRKALRDDRLAELVATRPPTFVVLDYFLEGVDLVNSNLDAFPIKKTEKQAVSRGMVFERVAAFGDFAIFRTVPVVKETQ